MGDPRGFLKVRTRRELAERPVEERIKDWFDVHTESGLQSWTTEQAARCMDWVNRAPGPPGGRPAAWIAEPRSA